MAAIQKRTGPRGTSYRALVRIAGHPPVSRSFGSKTKARLWANSTEAALREGRHADAAQAMKVTLADLIGRYLADVLPQRKLASARDHERHLRYWKKRIGSYAVGRVDSSLLSQEKYRLAKRVGPATVNRYFAALSALFKWVVREERLIERNPVRLLERLPESRGRKRFLSDEEREALLEACKQSKDARLYPLVVLALSTGARRGELLELRWSDLDLERGAAVLRDTKNGETRAVPVTGLASEVVGELGRVRRIDSDYLFADSEGKPTYPRKAWETALRAAQIEDFRFHDLRHSAASYLAMSGATLAEIAEVLGHKTLAMVKRYAHLTEQHTSAVVARMNERIFG